MFFICYGPTASRSHCAASPPPSIHGLPKSWLHRGPYSKRQSRWALNLPPWRRKASSNSQRYEGPFLQPFFHSFMVHIAATCPALFQCLTCKRGQDDTAPAPPTWLRQDINKHCECNVLEQRHAKTLLHSLPTKHHSTHESWGVHPSLA